MTIDTVRDSCAAPLVLLGVLALPASAQLTAPPQGAAARVLKVAPVPVVEEADHVYSYWPTNFRPWPTWPSYSTERHVNSGTYGLSFDVTSGELTRLGALQGSVSGAAGSLVLDNQVVEALPAMSVSYDVELSGGVHPATSFLGTDGSASNPSRLIDGGRFMQRVDIPAVSYASAPDLAGSVQLVTMPRHLVLTHRTETVTAETSNVSARVHLSGPAIDALTEVTVLEANRAVRMVDGAGDGWILIIPEVAGATAAIELPAEGGVTATRTVSQLDAGQTLAVSLLALPTQGLTDAQVDAYLHPGTTVRVQFAQQDRSGVDAEPIADAVFDPERGAYLVELDLNTSVGAPTYPNWSDPNHQTWYNRHRVVLQSESGEAVSIPVALDLEGSVIASITGGSAMFRDSQGEPLGLPVQISKNWHETQPVTRRWYHFYSTPFLPQGGRHELEFTIARAKWGSSFAASHAQLSLVGWGTNQQWDESALGCWGESVTYDPDLTLGRSMIDDVRPFLVQSQQLYNWTGNVGGADFLVYKPAGAAKDRLGRLRTLYQSPGPNLTDVVYAGVTLDGKIESSLRTRLGRGDDVLRVLYDLEYTILEAVTYDRLAFFQVAADNYSDNGFSRIAYGNAAAVVVDVASTPTGSVGYASAADRGISLSGDAPWVLLYGNLNSGGSLPEEFADVGFVVRDYELNVGGSLTTTPHINLVHTNNWGQHPQIGFELGVPYNPASPVLPAGTTLRATVEYLVLPADKTRYYGSSPDLLAAPDPDFGTPELMRTLAGGNSVEVQMAVGTLLRTHPISIAVSSNPSRTSGGEVWAEFDLTGGFGFVPMIFEGLDRHDGWRLERQFSGSWTGLGQEVEGNDYWQAEYDPSTKSYRLVFNVDNTGTTSYRLVR
jgi:hypothetical protein